LDLTLYIQGTELFKALIVDHGKKKKEILYLFFESSNSLLASTQPATEFSPHPTF
jgi:hypothetical protein